MQSSSVEGMDDEAAHVNVVRQRYPMHAPVTCQGTALSLNRVQACLLAKSQIVQACSRMIWCDREAEGSRRRQPLARAAAASQLQPACQPELEMSVISPYQTQGKWTHSSGGEINISVDGTGQSVVINHPTVGKQTLEVRKFCQGEGLDYFGFKGKLDGNKITWNNGVVWTKQA